MSEARDVEALASAPAEYKPPDVAVAEEEAENSLTWKLNEGKGKRVPFSFFAGSKELEPLGLGVIGYFKFLEAAIVISFLAAAIFGVPGAIINKNEGLYNGASSEIASEWTKYSYGNQRGDTNKTYRALFAVMLVVVFLTCVRFAYSIKKLTKDIERQTVSTADFSCCLLGLPADATDPDEIKELVIRLLSDTKFRRARLKRGLVERHPDTVKIAAISFALNSEEVVSFRQRADDLEHTANAKSHLLKLAEEKAKKESGCFTNFRIGRMKKSIDSMLTEARELRAKVAALENRPVENLGKAFITFETSALNDELISLLSTDFKKRLKAFWASLTGDAAHNALFKRSKTGDQWPWSLACEESPEPSDVLWSNLNVGFFQRHFRIGLGNSIMMITVICTAVALSAIYVAQKSNDNAKSAVYNFLLALTIQGLNKGSLFLANKLAVLEKHPSTSSYEEWLTLKRLAALFGNSAVAGFAGYILSSGLGSWYNAGSFMQQILVNCIIMGAVGSVMSLVQPFAHVKKFLGRRNAITQNELNDAYAPPVFSFNEAYVRICFIFSLGLVYAAAIPLGLLICFLALLFQYLSDRYFMLRVAKRPPMMDDDLVSKAFFYMRLAIFICIIATGLWFYNFTLASSAEVASKYRTYISIVLPIFGFFLFLWYMVFGDDLRKAIIKCFNRAENERKVKDASSDKPFSRVDPHLPLYEPPFVLSVRRSLQFGKPITERDQALLQSTFMNYAAYDARNFYGEFQQEKKVNKNKDGSETPRGDEEQEPEFSKPSKSLAYSSNPYHQMTFQYLESVNAGQRRIYVVDPEEPQAPPPVAVIYNFQPEQGALAPAVEQAAAPAIFYPQPPQEAAPSSPSPKSQPPPSPFDVAAASTPKSQPPPSPFAAQPAPPQGPPPSPFASQPAPPQGPPPSPFAAQPNGPPPSPFGSVPPHPMAGGALAHPFGL